MKKILTSTISLYQKTVSPLLHSIFGEQKFCRFEITCSDYAIAAIEKYGVIKGSSLAILRIAHCHPFASNTIKYESI